MLIKNYVSFIDNLRASLALYKFLCVVMTAGMVFSTFISYRAVKNIKTIILPPIVDSRIEITGTDANDNYFKMYAKYICGLLYNYTPETFPDQGADLIKLSAPSYRNDIKAKVDEMSIQLAELQITSTFHPFKFEIDRANSEIRALGNRVQSANGMVVEDGKKSITLKYIINNGRLQVNGIHETTEK